MRISDWSSDVCSSDLALRLDMAQAVRIAGPLAVIDRAVGRVAADPRELGDVVLARKDAPTSYHLSVALDDALQQVTLVTRGTDLFHAAPVHRQIGRAHV